LCIYKYYEVKSKNELGRSLEECFQPSAKKKREDRTRTRKCSSSTRIFDTK